MKDEIMIIDNVVSLDFSNLLEDIIFNDYPLFIGNKNSTSFLRENIEKSHTNLYEQFQFDSLLINQGKLSLDLDRFFSIITTPLILGLTQMEMFPSHKQIARCKVNVQTKSYENVDNRYNLPHVDNQFNQNMITAIYYVNDTDGDTFIFNKKLEEGKVLTLEEANNLVIKERVSPKKGRLVIFPSSYVHAGIHPQNNMFRSVINYNYYL